MHSAPQSALWSYHKSDLRTPMERRAQVIQVMPGSALQLGGVDYEANCDEVVHKVLQEVVPPNFNKEQKGHRLHSHCHFSEAAWNRDCSRVRKGKRTSK